MRTFVIAEGGICHDGSLDRAKEIIDGAWLAKADAVKFQFFDPERLSIKRKDPKLKAKVAPYAMPASWLPVLKEHAEGANLEFMCSTFDVEGLKEVAPLVSRLKIASPEAVDKAFVDAHYAYKKDILISCGAHPSRYVEPRTRWLWCISQYPCPLANARLDMIRKDRYDGYSDHTGCIQAGGWAVACGADIVEFHIRADDTSPNNPDFHTSLTWRSAAHYVENIRLAEIAVQGRVSNEVALRNFRTA